MTQANITIEDIPVSAPGIVAKLVKFQGQLDESNVDEKAKIIYDLLEQVPQNLYLLFDFEELEYMNSKSIGYLTDWYGKVTEGNGKIAIAKTRSNILDILQVVGLTQLINCYATLDEAKLALFQQPAVEAEAPTQPAPAPEAPAQQTPPTEAEPEQPSS
ncbi:MAG TPA: STAS domain-containing protein [Candidatus Gracilibacteria bacterium]|nr:STAS domain-containing protein [Candidatus Gracilibacteria bacterium]